MTATTVADLLPDNSVLPSGHIYCDVEDAFTSEDGKLIRATTQDIPSSYVDGLKWARMDSVNRRCKEVERVFSIPAVFVTKWLAQGLNVYNAPFADIVKKCHEEGCTDFLTTGKRL